jgi:hypothetical protein
MKKYFYGALLLAVSTLLASCGGGGGGGGSAATGVEPATVGLVITDLSSDDYDHAWATITSVTLIGENGHEQIFSGKKTVDLLSLRDHLKLFFVNKKVKPGFYSKIRLHVEELVLVKDNDGAPPTEDYVDLVANGKVDLNPQTTFYIAPGSVVFLSLDWDVDKSLKLIETGSGKIKMRPVIFVDIGTKPLFKKGLVRLFGTVESVAADDSGFRLCSMSSATPFPSTDVLKEFCVDIVLTDKTGVFNSNGEPRPDKKVVVDEELTVLGLLRRTEDAPPGPTPLAGVEDEPTSFQIESIVVEAGALGTWKQVRGTLTSTVDPGTKTFGFDPNSGLVCPAVTLVTGQLFDQSRVFRVGSDSGITEVAPPYSVLDCGDRAIVDAVPVGTDGLNIAVMLSRPPTSATADTLSGTIDSVSPELVVAGREVCTNISTRVFLLSDTGDVTEGAMGDLTVGSPAVVTGSDLGICLEADVIVSQEPPSP